MSRPSNDALKLTKRGILLVGALRAPSSLSRASQLSAVFGGPSEITGEHRSCIADPE
jgi:hypothetical protein